MKDKKKFILLIDGSENSLLYNLFSIEANKDNEFLYNKRFLQANGKSQTQEKLGHFKIDLVFLNISKPSISAKELAKIIGDTPVVLVMSRLYEKSRKDIAEIKNAGIGVLVSPFETDKLRQFF